ncbi:MAG: hypothetical protein S4CHLAM102_16100 [Chlamydiia bacterium]|nr:hypothetical protein [Chlamydiia bacterium]
MFYAGHSEPCSVYCTTFAQNLTNFLTCNGDTCANIRRLGVVTAAVTTFALSFFGALPLTVALMGSTVAFAAVIADFCEAPELFLLGLLLSLVCIPDDGYYYYTPYYYPTYRVIYI